MKLWLVRHAQPLIAPGVCYGATDVAADEAATRQAAETLAQILPINLKLFSSPLQRCELLTLYLKALRPDLSNKTDARLVEMNFGCWEGQRWDAIPEAAYAHWTADFGEHCFGGVESSNLVLARVTSAWEDARANGQDVVWITHAGVIRAASLLAKGVREVQSADQWPVQAPGYGQWCLLDGL